MASVQSLAGKRCVVESCGRRLDKFGCCPSGHDQIQGGSREYIRCSHDDCSHPAIAKQKTTHGFANLCMSHYEKYHLNLAKDFCKELDLNTTEKKRAFIKSNLPRIGAMKGMDHWKTIIEDWKAGDKFHEITLKYAHKALGLDWPIQPSTEVDF